MDDDQWEWFPPDIIHGSLHDLSDHPEPTPRLAGMRSVSEAAARALHRTPARPEARKAGFAHHLVRGTKPSRN